LIQRVRLCYSQRQKDHLISSRLLVTKEMANCSKHKTVLNFLGGARTYMERDLDNVDVHLFDRSYNNVPGSICFKVSRTTLSSGNRIPSFDSSIAVFRIYTLRGTNKRLAIEIVYTIRHQSSEFFSTPQNQTKTPQRGTPQMCK